MAANILGLSQQVPAKIVYLSDGPRRKFQVSNQIILFRHSGFKDMRMENYSSRLIAQALRFLGRGNVEQQVIGYLRRKLSEQEKMDFLQDARYGTDWILDVAQKIAQEDDHE